MIQSLDRRRCRHRQAKVLAREAKRHGELCWNHHFSSLHRRLCSLTSPPLALASSVIRPFFPLTVPRRQMAVHPGMHELAKEHVESAPSSGVLCYR